MKNFKEILIGLLAQYFMAKYLETRAQKHLDAAFSNMAKNTVEEIEYNARQYDRLMDQLAELVPSTTTMRINVGVPPTCNELYREAKRQLKTWENAKTKIEASLAAYTYNATMDKLVECGFTNTYPRLVDPKSMSYRARYREPDTCDTARMPKGSSTPTH